MTTNFDSDISVSAETQNLSPMRHRVHVKFTDSLENEAVLPVVQTNLLKIEPCFNVTVTEDEGTKNFYQNQSQIIIGKHDNVESVRERTLSEADSLECEDSSNHIKKAKQLQSTNDHNQQSTSPSVKSILKKADQIKEEKPMQSSASVSSSRKRQKSSERLDFDEVLHLAELNAKMNATPNSMYQRSLFDQTINIFDPNRPSYIISNDQSRFRSQFYIKPYREKPSVSTGNTNSKRRSRSLSQHRRGQQSDDKARSHSRSSQRSRPLDRQETRKQHVSWSPTREYIRSGTDNTDKIIANKNPKSSEITKSSTLKPRSSTSAKKFDQATCHPVVSIPASKQIVLPDQVQFSSPASSTDLYHTPAASEISLTTITTKPEEEFIEVEDHDASKSHLSETTSQRQKVHNATMERYDRLLEKMRTTDEQLQSLTQSWVKNKQPQSPVKQGRDSSLSLNRKTRENDTFFSPATLQICLFILVLFNLLVVYFFHEINLWWSQHVAPAITIQQHDEDTLNF